MEGEKPTRLYHRRRRLSGELRRRQLLEVALKSFSAKGYEATTMDEIAEGAGVTKPLLYQHFHSKKDLYMKLLETTEKDLISVLSKAATPSKPPRERLESAMEAFFDFVAKHEGAFRLLFSHDQVRDPDIAAVLERAKEKVSDFIVPLLDVPVSIKIKRLVARSVVGLVEGALTEWLSWQEESELTPRQAAALVGELAWAGLRRLHTGES